MLAIHFVDYVLKHYFLEDLQGSWIDSSKCSGEDPDIKFETISGADRQAQSTIDQLAKPGAARDSRGGDMGSVERRRV